MSALSFEKDIRCLFSKYVADMQKVNLSSSSGTQTLQLGNYDSVKFFYYEIQVSIHGYDYDSNGNPLVPPEKRLHKRGGGPDDFVTSAPHAMPPDGRMPQVAIDIYDQWVKDGLLP